MVRALWLLVKAFSQTSDGCISPSSRSTPTFLEKQTKKSTLEKRRRPGGETGEVGGRNQKAFRPGLMDLPELRRCLVGCLALQTPRHITQTVPSLQRLHMMKSTMLVHEHGCLKSCTLVMKRFNLIYKDIHACGHVSSHSFIQ